MTTTRRLGALLGVVSALAGLAVAELLSGYLHQRVSPVIAVAESIIALTPGAVIEFVISLVGQNDKQLLIGTTLVGLLLVSAGVGILAFWSIPAAVGAFVVMGLVAALAVADRLTSSSTTYVPIVIGTVVSVATLVILAPRALASLPPQASDQAGEEPSWRDHDASRRQFLALSGAVALAAVFAGGAGRLLARSRAAVEAARRTLRLPVRAVPAPADVEVDVRGVEPWVTSQAQFYRIDTALSVPQILPDDWELRIHGMVDNELTLSYQDLLDRGLEQAWITLCCVSNQVGGDLISNASWSGVRIADVLAEAGVHEDADAVLSTSQDGWTCGTPLAVLTDDRNALFAVAMNGEPLNPEHGFPVRMVVPGLYGYVSATKWVVDLEVSRFSDFSAFWTDRGWSAQGPVKTQSRIDVPKPGADLAAGDVVVAGIAWAQHTGVMKVEVSVDGGAWAAATLAAHPSIDTWRQWSYVWSATSGEHEIAVRATDASGYTQTGELADVIPDGATGWHTISVDIG